ncbi:MAG: protein-L-isoaspartate O-methyltransferase [Betaproteobacteria bacterium]|nr:protein-L-isoaspartate O-methyltransferase [Betaproteobacteria bacterium]
MSTESPLTSPSERTRDASDSYAQMRRNMISQQIRPWDVLEPRILDLLERHPRHMFVPPEHQALAYVDMEVPLAHGQVMLAPKVEARILQELDLRPEDDVFEVGTGSGYMAALLGSFGQSVVSVEKYADLAEYAQTHLASAGAINVTVMQGNGLLEDARWSHRLFDVIVISGGVLRPPESLLAQLKPRGRMIALIGQAPVMQATLIERLAGSYRETGLFDTLTLPLEDQPVQPEFTF